MGPDLIPVRGDGRASLDGRGQLERTRAAVVVAVDGRVRRVSDGVAVEREKWFRQDVIANKFCVGYALARPRALDSGLTSGRVVGLYASEISACNHR